MRSRFSTILQVLHARKILALLVNPWACFSLESARSTDNMAQDNTPAACSSTYRDLEDRACDPYTYQPEAGRDPHSFRLLYKSLEETGWYPRTATELDRTSNDISRTPSPRLDSLPCLLCRRSGPILRRRSIGVGECNRSIVSDWGAGSAAHSSLRNNLGMYPWNEGEAFPDDDDDSVYEETVIATSSYYGDAYGDDVAIATAATAAIHPALRPRGRIGEPPAIPPRHRPVPNKPGTAGNHDSFFAATPQARGSSYAASSAYHIGNPRPSRDHEDVVNSARFVDDLTRHWSAPIDGSLSFEQTRCQILHGAHRGQAGLSSPSRLGGGARHSIFKSKSLSNLLSSKRKSGPEQPMKKSRAKASMEMLRSRFKKGETTNSPAVEPLRKKASRVLLGKLHMWK